MGKFEVGKYYKKGCKLFRCTEVTETRVKFERNGWPLIGILIRTAGVEMSLILYSVESGITYDIIVA